MDSDYYIESVDISEDIINSLKLELNYYFPNTFEKIIQIMNLKISLEIVAKDTSF